MPSRFDQLLAGRFEPHLTCRYFDAVLWRDRDAHLTTIGFNPLPRGGWHEVDRKTAIDLLSSAMAIDLCYGLKNLPRGTAREFAEGFCAPLHWQDRFFTDASRPWDGNVNGWSFGPLTEATMDTGVIVKSGESFAGLFWIASWD